MTTIGVSAGGLGNPSMKGDGSLPGISAPVPVGPESAGLAAVLRRREEQDAALLAADARLPRSVSPKDQAKAADGNFGRGNLSRR
jgi:hypothetical protein